MMDLLDVLRAIIIMPPIQWLLAVLLFSYGMEKRRHWEAVYAASVVLQLGILIVLIFWHQKTGDTAIMKGVRFTLPFTVMNGLTLWATGKANLREVLLRLVGVQSMQNILWSTYALTLIPGDQSVVSETSSIVMVALMAVLYPAFFLIFRPHLRQKLDYHNLPVLLVAILALYLKDFLKTTPYKSLSDIVINLLAMGILFDLFQERKLNQQLAAMEQILSRERRQHELVKEEIDIINRKCHDLKHQILLINANGGLGEFGAEAEKALEIYDSSIRTGSEVLDVVLMEKQLYCKEHHIDLTYLADGGLLAMMKAGDVASLFGNILDNAIEYVKTLPEQKRIIRLRVAPSGGFLCIHCENPYEGTLVLQNGLPQTDKPDKENHGFGMLSIRYIAEQYGGVCSVQQRQRNFELNILIPLESECA